jgi:glycosyltransferase involved in cell wall biosynthesis
VWVVVDGSTDGSAEQLQALAASDDGLRVIVLPENRGKGAAVLEGITQAAALGYTHALTMDSDGQHPADLIPAFMAASQAAPERMVLGKPVFGPEAPPCASMAARCRTAGPIWKRCGWASAIRCTASASIPLRR